MQLVYQTPTAEDYVSLRLRSGMGNKDLERSRTALKNSLFTVSLYDKEKLIGFGRIVGDGGITYVVSDIMVDREYQRQGFAEKIMQAIDHYFEENAHDDKLCMSDSEILLLTCCIISISLNICRITNAECCGIKVKKWL